jgi:hypothetical protein
MIDEEVCDQVCNLLSPGVAAILHGQGNLAMIEDMKFTGPSAWTKMGRANWFHVFRNREELDEEISQQLLDTCEKGSQSSALRIGFYKAQFTRSVIRVAPLIQFLRVLVVKDCFFDEFQWTSFCAAVGESKTLSRLAIFDLARPQPISELTRALRMNKSVRSLQMFPRYESSESDDEMIALGELLAVNRTIRSICTDLTFVASDIDRPQGASYFSLLDGLQKNTVIRHLCTSSYCDPRFNAFYGQHVKPVLAKNCATPHWCDAHNFIVNACLALAPIDLPTYALLWTFDWLPGYANLGELQKVRLIESVQRSVLDVRERRAPTNKRTSRA